MTVYNGYKIEHMGTFSLYQIKSTGQGPVPAALRGMFSTTEVAKTFIDSYLKTKKGSKNGKATSTSTD